MVQPAPFWLFGAIAAVVLYLWFVRWRLATAQGKRAGFPAPYQGERWR